MVQTDLSLSLSFYVILTSHAQLYIVQIMSYYYKVAELDNFSLVVERKNNIKWRKIFFNFLWNKLSLDPQVPHT